MKIQDVINEITNSASNEIKMRRGNKQSLVIISKQDILSYLAQNPLTLKHVKYSALEYRYVECKYILQEESGTVVEIFSSVQRSKPPRKTQKPKLKKLTLKSSPKSEAKLGRIESSLNSQRQLIKQSNQISIHVTETSLVECPMCKSMVRNDRIEKHIKKVHNNSLSSEITVKDKSLKRAKKSRQNWSKSVRTLQGGLPSLGKKK